MPSNATNLSRKGIHFHESFRLEIVTFHVLKGTYCTKKLDPMFESVQNLKFKDSKNCKNALFIIGTTFVNR